MTPAAWTTRIGGRPREQLGAPRSDGHVIVYTWTSAVGRWSAQDVTARTGRTAAGALSAWQTRDGPYVVEHLAGRSTGGALLVFYRSSRDSRWKVVDVTAKTGRHVADGLTSWQSRSGPFNVEHVAGRDSTGNLLVFWWSPAHDWQVVNVSAKTGRRIASPATSWQLRKNGRNTEYVAGSAADGRVTVFAWTRATDWRAAVLPQSLPGGVTAWVVGRVEHLGGAEADGSLIVLWRSGGQGWRRIDVSHITAEPVQGPPAAYRLRDGEETVELLASCAPDGHLIAHWWKPSRDWQALDLSEINGATATTAPAAWLTSSGSRIVEHLAFNGGDGRLRVLYSFDQPRTLTDAVGAGYESVRLMRNTTRKVLLVLMDQHAPNPLGRPTAAAVRQTVFGGAGQSVRGFFLENSGGAFTITEARTVGWYEADQPPSYYGPHDRMGAALRAANPDVDFSRYDADGDGTLEPREVAIYFLHPGRAGGLGRTGSRSIKDVDGGELKLDGVRIHEGIEGGIGNPPNLGVVAHELSHPLLGLPDMYAYDANGQYFTPTSPTRYSLMDNTYASFHIDAFNKLKLGWARPRLVFRGGAHTLPDIETRNRVLVLLDPSHGTREYFLVENRYAGASYDVGLPDQGLGVWHVMEERAVYESAAPPGTVDPAKWASIKGQWGRSAVRMVRPLISLPLDDRRALWDGSDYPLLSNDPDPLHSSLRWGDGTPSGFALHGLGTASGDFALMADVPPMP